MATHSTTTPQPNLGIILETLQAYQRTYAFRTAIELDLFTRIGEGAGSVAEIAARCSASERGIRILCDYLVLLGFLTKSPRGYGLSSEAALFLDKRSVAYVGSVAGFLAHDRHMAGYQDLAEVVRRGGPADSGYMGPDDPIWVEFARSMTPMMRFAAQQFAPLVADQGRAMKVLDIAAGHGMYGIAVARHNAAAQIFAVDWEPVLRVASENAAQAGVAGRYHTIPGSAFTVDFGGAYDLVLLPAFLHHFDPPANVGLLRKLRAAMNPEWLLAIVEIIPEEDHLSPPFAAAFSLTMLAGTPAGDAYTFPQLEQMLCEAGFRENRPHPLEGLPLTAIFSRP